MRGDVSITLAEAGYATESDRRPLSPIPARKTAGRPGSLLARRSVAADSIRFKESRPSSALLEATLPKAQRARVLGDRPHDTVGTADQGQLTLRLAVGGPRLAGTAGWLKSIGYRPSKPWAVLVGLSEFGGGTLTALGLLHPLGPMPPSASWSSPPSTSTAASPSGPRRAARNCQSLTWPQPRRWRWTDPAPSRPRPRHPGAQTGGRTRPTGGGRRRGQGRLGTDRPRH